jgi:phosphatidylglycerol:prolipoprotein diacylglycerol transferase
MLTYQAFIQSPGDTFLNLGFLTIRWYGLLISISVVIGLFISKKLAKSRNINPQYISDILPSLIISSIIGARAYYVIFEWRQYSGNNFFTSFDLFNNVIQIPLFSCNLARGHSNPWRLNWRIFMYFIFLQI